MATLPAMDAATAAVAPILASLRTIGWRLAVAESCTGGLVAAALTSVPGSSDVFDRGFLTYSNAAKSDMLGVDPALVVTHGAVSREVAAAMAEGALRAAGVDVAVAVTGIAGPGGATAEKPVGLVYIACAVSGRPTTVEEYRFGNAGRETVRAASVEAALHLLSRALGGAS
jgi:nicotinamide-nucleotide amidase